MSKHAEAHASPASLLRRAKRMSYVRLAVIAAVGAANAIFMYLLSGDTATSNTLQLVVVACCATAAMIGILALEERYISKPLYLGVGEYWQRIATRDSLTGLHNRLAFMNHLNTRLSESAGGARFALLFIDLNHFKAINDTHGHGAGDTVLAVTARRIKKTLSKDDVIARLGGDEFAVILNNANVKTAQEAADSLDLVLRTPMQVGGIMIGVSASVGMFMNMNANSDAEDVMHEADMAMYRRKANERWRNHLSVNGGRVRGIRRAARS